MSFVNEKSPLPSQPIRDLTHSTRSVVTFKCPNRFTRGDVLRLYLPVFEGGLSQPTGIQPYDVVVIASGPSSVVTSLSTLVHGRIDVGNSHIRYYGQFRAFKIGEQAP